jgi:hypothetical protein
MAYFNTNLIARRGYAGRRAVASGMGGLLDDIESGLKSVVGFYGQEQQQQGAANVLQAQNAALTNALAAQQNQGISSTTLLVGGLAALGIFLVVRKKHG